MNTNEYRSFYKQLRAECIDAANRAGEGDYVAGDIRAVVREGKAAGWAPWQYCEALHNLKRKYNN